MHINVLLRRFPCPTLAEIIHTWRKDNREQRNLVHLSGRYDAAFGDRADYRLWRQLIVTVGRPLKIDQWSTGEAWQAAINSPEPIIRWGALALVSGWLTSQRSDGEHDDVLREIAVQCESVVDALAPIRGGESECAAVRLLARDAAQHFRWGRDDSKPTIEAAREYVERLVHDLREFDPRWKPGGGVAPSSWRTRDHRIVLPYRDMQTIQRIAVVLYRARAVITAAVEPTTVFDATTAHLLDLSAAFALSSWRTSWSIRKWGRRGTGRRRRPRFDFDALQHDELGALHRAAQAARDAGHFGDAAGLAHLLLRIVPDDVVEQYRHVADQLSFAVRQVGLGVDPRFGLQRPSSAIGANDDAAASAEPVEGTDPGASATRKSRGAPSRKLFVKAPYDLRLENDLLTNPNWKTFLAYRPNDQLQPLRLLSKCVREEVEQMPEDVLEAAFWLALRYARLRDAAEIARRLQPHPRWVTAYARAIGNALRIMPFGVDENTYVFWLRILRTAWSYIRESDVRPNDAWDIHEVLLGRYLSIMSEVDERAGKLFALRYYRLLDDREISEALDGTQPVRIHGGRALSRPDFVDTLQNVQSVHGVPVCISLVLFENDEVSMVATDVRGRCMVRRVTLPGLTAAARQIMENHHIWPARVIWPVPFPDLAEAIDELMRELAPTKWLMLAVDPAIAGVPWQHLVHRYIRRDVIVSLAPSFTWMARAQRRIQHAEGQMIVDRSSDLAPLRTFILDTEETLRKRLDSCTVVLGHGVRARGALPSVRSGLGHELDMERWMSALSTSRVVIVHSCHGGFGSGGFLGNLGGLPGLAVSLGCRLFFAPVAAVPLDTARTLHEALIGDDGPREFGARYLAAIERDWRVALYTLYGFANERLETAASRDVVPVRPPAPAAQNGTIAPNTGIVL